MYSFLNVFLFICVRYIRSLMLFEIGFFKVDLLYSFLNVFLFILCALYSFINVFLFICVSSEIYYIFFESYTIQYSTVKY